MKGGILLVPYKKREKSKLHKTLELLDARMELPDDKKRYYHALKKGYEGERMFDRFLEQSLHNDCYVLNDLLLQHNNTTFQIDNLLIFSELVYPFEVKNFDGDYYYENEQIFSKSGLELVNPLNQLSKTESLLRKLLQSLNFPLPISPKIVFINPEFTLYQAPLDKPFLFHSQLHRFFKQLNEQPSHLTEKHKWLANKLISLHISDYPVQQLPKYRYDELRKGIICENCSSFALEIVGQKCICRECKHVEVVRDAILRSVWEYRLLFPDRVITTANIHEWCQIIESRRRIKRVLDENFEIVGSNRWISYK